MIEVSKRKMVKTRKEHKCYFCGNIIMKAEEAVNISAREDGRYKSLHMHPQCNQDANKINLFDEQRAPIALKDFSVAETEYPFE